MLNCMVTGGCGACVVLVSTYDPKLKKVEDFSVSPCLKLLCSLNGCSITTSEGLGNTRDGFHAIHERANLCRCTGYRPIADACKTFVADVDIEDLGINSFWEKGDSKETKVSKLPPYDPTKNFSTYPEFLKSESTKNLDSSRYPWYSPVSIEELRSLLNSKVMENDASYASFKLLVGNTGSVHYKETQRYNHYVDIKHVPEPSIINEDQTGIEVGATVTIAKFISFLNEESKIKFGSYGKLVSEKLAYHMEKIVC
ncbi:hypothetical protein FXO38_21087 [Capsicum annuum]|nr:hypothetical protein FXO38_21087 [Capsicum annuum]